MNKRSYSNYKKMSKAIDREYGRPEGELKDFEKKVEEEVFQKTLDSKAAVHLSEEEVVWAYNDDKSVKETAEMVIANWFNHLANC